MERGQAVAVGFVLVVAIIVSLVAYFFAYQLPQLVKNAEAQHMEVIKAKIGELKTKMLGLVATAQSAGLGAGLATQSRQTPCCAIGKGQSCTVVFSEFIPAGCELLSANLRVEGGGDWNRLWDEYADLYVDGQHVTRWCYGEPCPQRLGCPYNLIDKVWTGDVTTRAQDNRLEVTIRSGPQTDYSYITAYLNWQMRCPGAGASALAQLLPRLHFSLDLPMSYEALPLPGAVRNSGTLTVNPNATNWSFPGNLPALRTGAITLSFENNYFPDQEYSLDSDMLILNQAARSVLLDKPSIAVDQTETSITVSLKLFNFEPRVSSASQRPIRTGLRVVNVSFYSNSTTSPVTYEVTSPNAPLWESFWRGELQELSATVTRTGNAITITINPGNKQLVTEVLFVQLEVERLR